MKQTLGAVVAGLVLLGALVGSVFLPGDETSGAAPAEPSAEELAAARTVEADRAVCRAWAASSGPVAARTVRDQILWADSTDDFIEWDAILEDLTLIGATVEQVAVTPGLSTDVFDELVAVRQAADNLRAQARGLGDGTPLDVSEDMQIAVDDLERLCRPRL